MCSSYVYICLFLFLFTPTPIPIHSTSIQWKTWSDSVIADQLSYLNHAMLSAIPLTQFITWAYSKSKVCLYYYYNIILYFFNFFNYIFFHFFIIFFFFFFILFSHTTHIQESECRELWQFIQHFNRLVYWTASEIVVRIRKAEVCVMCDVMCDV